MHVGSSCLICFSAIGLIRLRKDNFPLKSYYKVYNTSPSISLSTKSYMTHVAALAGAGCLRQASPSGRFEEVLIRKEHHYSYLEQL